MKKILIIISLVIFSLLTVNNFAYAENFYIENYNVRLEVLENKKVKIEETIDVNFHRQSHGIYRTIPTKLNQAYETSNSSVSQNSNITKRKKYSKAKIRNIKSSEQYSLSISQNGELTIKIGNPKVLIKGRHRYKISYDYCFPKDPLEGNDEFYFNIIGTQWPVQINNANFSITMPKEFNPEDVGLSIGKYGTRGFKDNALYKITGNIIEGNTTKTLAPYEGITIRILLPDNYFTIPDEAKYNKARTLTILGIIFFTFCSFIIWYLYGKDDIAIPVICFAPPRNKNSAQLGTNYRGYADDKDIVSLIFYLASKGFIEIIDNGNNYTINKIKNYNGKNASEAMLMNALFGYGEYSVRTTKYELENSPTFYLECGKIKEMLNKEKETMFEKTGWCPKNIFINSVSIFGIFALLLFSMGDYSFDVMKDLISTGVILFIIPIFGIFATFSIKKKNFKTIALFLSLHVIIPSYLIYSITSVTLSYDPFILKLSAISLIISITCLINLPKRNKKGIDLYGYILGFKKFLETAERHRIEQLTGKIPTYYYDILPYAYVLDISDKWIRKFEGIVKEQPNWYKGTTRFNASSFGNLASSLCHVSGPTTQNGGIKSSGGGGGFSGGGGGGGGGGSW